MPVRRITAALLLLLPLAAFATTPQTFIVKQSTEAVDSDTGQPVPMPAGAMLGSSLDCGPTPTPGDFANGWGWYGSLDDATPLTVDFADGTWYCAAHTSIAGRRADGSWNLESAYSNVITLTFPAPSQPPPTTTPPPPVVTDPPPPVVPTLPTSSPGLIVILK